jgi:hypothetical protein
MALFEIPVSAQLAHVSASRGVDLQFLSVAQGSKIFAIAGSARYDLSGRNLIRHFGKCAAIVVPGTVEVIGQFSFDSCGSLMEINHLDGTWNVHLPQSTRTKC